MQEIENNNGGESRKGSSTINGNNEKPSIKDHPYASLEPPQDQPRAQWRKWLSFFCGIDTGHGGGGEGVARPPPEEVLSEEESIKMYTIRQGAKTKALLFAATMAICAVGVACFVLPSLPGWWKVLGGEEEL